MSEESKSQEVIIQQEPKQQAVAHYSESDSIMESIVRLAADPSIDIGRLDKLMDFKERMEASEAKKLFAIDFARMKPHLPKVAEKGFNTQTKSAYAFLDDINQTIDPVLGEYGFATSTKIVSQTADSVTVKAELWHKAGHMEETTLTMPIDNKGSGGTVNKTIPHAIKSTVTYLKGATICALLNISTGKEDDKDGNVDTDSITMEQAADIDMRVRALGDEYMKRFMDWINKYNTKTIPEIKVSDYKRIITAIVTAENEAKKAAGKKVQK